MVSLGSWLGVWVNGVIELIRWIVVLSLSEKMVALFLGIGFLEGVGLMGYWFYFEYVELYVFLENSYSSCNWNIENWEF